MGFGLQNSGQGQQLNHTGPTGKRQFTINAWELYRHKVLGGSGDWKPTGNQGSYLSISASMSLSLPPPFLQISRHLYQKPEGLPSAPSSGCLPDCPLPRLADRCPQSHLRLTLGRVHLSQRYHCPGAILCSRPAADPRCLPVQIPGMERPVLACKRGD